MRKSFTVVQFQGIEPMVPLHDCFETVVILCGRSKQFTFAEIRATGTLIDTLTIINILRYNIKHYILYSDLNNSFHKSSSAESFITSQTI